MATPAVSTQAEKSQLRNQAGRHDRVTGSRSKRVDALTATAFVTPAMIGFLLFVIIPALAGLGLAFFDWDLFSTPQFVGLANIERLFTDPAMWQSLEVTALFVVLGVIPTIIIGFLLAVLVNTRLRGVSVLRVFYFAPMIASSAVASVIWASLYSPRLGLLNHALSWVGIEGPSWLSSTTWALPALVIMMIWGALPLVIILYMAGLQRVPDDIYAAASLDGAGSWRQIWSMTWPNVWPTTLLVTVLQAVSFISGSFEIALIMTNGGPLGATTSLALYSYQMAFENRDIGYASALSLFQLVLMGIIVVLVRTIVRFRKARS